MSSSEDMSHPGYKLAREANRAAIKAMNERDELIRAREQEPTERAVRRAATVLHNRLCDDKGCDGVNDYVDAARAALLAAKEAGR